MQGGWSGVQTPPIASLEVRQQNDDSAIVQLRCPRVTSRDIGNGGGRVVATLSQPRHRNIKFTSTKQRAREGAHNGVYSKTSTENNTCQRSRDRGRSPLGPPMGQTQSRGVVLRCLEPGSSLLLQEQCLSLRWMRYCLRNYAHADRKWWKHDLMPDTDLF